MATWASALATSRAPTSPPWNFSREVGGFLLGGDVFLGDEDFLLEAADVDVVQGDLGH